MHIIFVTQESFKEPSGVHNVITHLCREWNEEDQITILTNREYWGDQLFISELFNKSNIKIKHLPFYLPSELFGRLKRFGLPRIVNLAIRFLLIPLQLAYSSFIILWLAFWMKDKAVDAIISHNGGWPGGEMNRWAVISDRLAGIKNNLLIIHSMPAYSRLAIKAFTIIRDRIVSFCCTEIITVSQACRKSIEEGTGFNRPIRVIYNGIRVSRPQLKQSEQPPWPKKHITIGFVGGLHHMKGVHVILNSISYIDTPCEVVLIGNGDDEYTSHLKELADLNKWPTYFLGFRNDALELYQWLDIVVLASIQFESFGLVLLEAMLWEKPVVCSNFGGMKELVEHEKTGLVVPANDSGSLAEALERLLTDETLRNQMGELGRKRLEQFFSAEIMVDNYRALFKCN